VCVILMYISYFEITRRTFCTVERSQIQRCTATPLQYTSTMNPLRSIFAPATSLFLFASSSLKRRKSLLLMLRAARNPYHDRLSNTTLWRMNQFFFDQYAVIHGHTGLERCVISLDWILESTCRTSIAKSTILAMPISKSCQTRIKRDMVIKELSAMESTPRESTVNWSAIFEGFSDYEIIPGNPHRRVTRGVHFRIKAWADRQSSAIIYPHFGTKILASRSKESLDFCFDDRLPMSSIQAEVHYSRTAEEGFGPVEMKQAWRPAHLVPRTYFAQGLSSFHASKYLRNAFNQLGDLFRNTNRFERTIPGLIMHSPQNKLYIYDLTSFSSLFHEHRSMLLALADQVEDTDVEIYDSHFGLSHTSLSFLIRQYVQECVDRPSYVTLLYPMDSFLEFRHNVAGFLGVYGNIITCTIGHGILLATVDDSFNTNWCAGDDAGSSTEEEKFPVLDRTVRHAGSYAEEKVFEGHQPGAVALKRSLTISHGYIQLHNTPFFPLLGAFMNVDMFGNHKFPHVDFSTFCHGVVLFCQHVIRFDLESDALPLIPYIRSCFGSFSQPPWNIHCNPSSPDRIHKYRCYVPIVDHLMFHLDPLDRIAEYYYKGVYSRQAEEDCPFDSEMLLESSFICNVTPWLKWASSMGYLRSTKVMVHLFGMDGLRSFRRDLHGYSSHLPLYSFQIVDVLPVRHTRHLYEF